MPETIARRRAIRRILDRNSVSSQSDLVEHLANDGFTVTQATVSRDLKELGAFKVRSPVGKSKYALPGAESGSADGAGALPRALAEFAESIEPSGNLIVIKTDPGAAQVVAAALDAVKISGVIGTVAGDDTLLVITGEKTGGLRVAKQLERIGGGA